MSYINALLRAPKDINVEVNTKVSSKLFHIDSTVDGWEDSLHKQ
jgi:hypothetical protein